jgi:hypothetical protein
MVHCYGANLQLNKNTVATTADTPPGAAVLDNYTAGTELHTT